MKNLIGTVMVLSMISLASAERKNVTGEIDNIRINSWGNIGVSVKIGVADWRHLWIPGNSVLGKNMLATILSARASGTDTQLNFRYEENSPGTNNNQGGGCANFESAAGTPNAPGHWNCNEVLFIDFLK